MELFTAAALTALFSVIAIDLVLAGDNAVVIGMAAAGLDPKQRRTAIIIGIAAATVLRIVFALAAAYLLMIPGLQLAGGLLLAYVCWGMWSELRSTKEDVDENHNTGTKTLKAAVWQIIIADVSMSLDNVLAVAGAAREHPSVLIFGLALSIALTAFAANFIANLLNKHRWIGYVGLAIIVYVAGKMIYHGFEEVLPHIILSMV
ncbi:integral membrane protein [Rhizobium phage RHph_I1_18]|nr:integral membrane protein [Rhizobium phage RHph_I1_18]